MNLRYPWWQCRKCKGFTHVSHLWKKNPRCPRPKESSARAAWVSPDAERCGFTRGRFMTHGQKLRYFERKGGRA